MKSVLNTFYKRLYSYFGPQRWWPARNRFEVMIGAILTQNTSWSNVEKAIKNLKKNKLLALSKLYALPHNKLASQIKSSGYYNLKARRLKEFIKFLYDHYNASLKKMSGKETCELRKHLLSVNGIGQETADSILLYALNKPIFVVDAYTRRILLRHYLIKEDYSYTEVQNLFMQNLNPVTNNKIKKGKTVICNGARNDARHVRNVDKSYRKNISNVVKLFNEYHALFVKLGKDICLKSKPQCNICPLKNYKHKAE